MAHLKDRIAVVSAYTFFIISVLMNFYPSLFIQTLGGILFMITIFLCMILKYVVKEDFDKNHLAYLLKTIWVFSFFTIAGVVLLFIFGKHQTLTQISEEYLNQGFVPTNEELFNILYDYSIENIMPLFIIFMPIAIYLLYRLSKGIYLLLQNESPENLKNWF
ncbi:MAG: hypothetical protein AAF549_01215 [Pseudomonadota bacterium]